MGALAWILDQAVDLSMTLAKLHAHSRWRGLRGWVGLPDLAILRQGTFSPKPESLGQADLEHRCGETYGHLSQIESARRGVDTDRAGDAV